MVTEAAGGGGGSGGGGGHGGIEAVMVAVGVAMRETPPVTL